METQTGITAGTTGSPLIINPSAAPVLEEREASLTISTGFQGTGKSYQTLHTIMNYLRDHPKRKVLIYDVNREYSQQECAKHGINVNIPLLTPTVTEMLRFSAHQTERLRRILPVNMKTGQDLDIQGKKNLLIDILTNFRGGLLLIEDINKYLNQMRHVEEVLSILISLRHQNLDVIIHLQTLAKLDPTMWENVKFIRMHWQNDSVDRYENRIPNFKLVKTSQLLVNYMYHERSNPHFFVWLYNQKNKITGAFSKEDFFRAYYRYLKIEKTELADTCNLNFLNIKNINDRKKAVEQCFMRAEYMYGNSV